MLKKSLLISGLLFLSLLNIFCYAQDSTGNKIPAAVLVRLRTGQNRVIALEKMRQHAMAEQLAHDETLANTAMINDFQANFHACPVYYFIDTNSDLVEDKKFDNILLSADGTPAKNIVISPTSSNYLIAFYGRPDIQPRDKDVLTPDVYPGNNDITNSGDMANATGLVILNDKFQQVNYFYKMGYDGLFGKKKNLPKNAFKSKKTGIEYFPFAMAFNTRLADRSGYHRLLIPKSNER